MRKSLGILTTLSLSAMLVACGGGGGGGTSSATPNAITEGTWTGNVGAYILNILILENGDLYSLYGTNSGGIFSVYGFFRSLSTVSGNTLNAPYSDYSGGTSSTGTLTATVQTGVSMSGTIANSAGATANFSAIPTSPSSSTYNYNEKPNTSNVTGDWTGTISDGTAASISIGTDGSISGSNQGCNFTGMATPRSSGKNVFDMRVTFDPSSAACAYPGQSVSGVAFNYALNSGGKSRQLVALMNDTNKTHGYMFFAQR